MFKRFLFLSFAVLTFGIGVGISSLSTTTCRRSTESVFTMQARRVPAISTGEMKRTYETAIQASGRAGKYAACFGRFSSSDGMTFKSTNISFDSPQQAQRELQKRLKKAHDIVSREDLVDITGRVVGEKVVATFPHKKKVDGPAAELIFVSDSEFISVASSSLRNIIEYKRDLNY